MKYITDLIARTHMFNCKITPAPASALVRLGKYMGSTFYNLLLLKSTIGVLQYILLTRAELGLVFNRLSHHAKTTKAHWTSYKHVLLHSKDNACWFTF